MSRVSSIDDQEALAELWTLATCREIITSVHSTFGYVAQALASETPWVVMEGEQGCKRWDTSAPCLHTYHRVAQGIDQKCGAAGGWSELAESRLGLRRGGCRSP